jgi:type VI secretion system protein
MNQGLFESLTGTFLDGAKVEDVAVANRRILSIMDHLTRMFNTRRGITPHLKEYGLPDVSEIYRKMPHGMEELQQAIVTAVEKYEPRLTRVRVTPREHDKSYHRMIFILTAELKGTGQRVRFQTTFASSGESSVNQWKQRDD